MASLLHPLDHVFAFARMSRWETITDYRPLDSVNLRPFAFSPEDDIIIVLPNGAVQTPDAVADQINPIEE